LLILQLISARSGYISGKNSWRFQSVEVLPSYTGETGLRTVFSDVLVPSSLNSLANKIRFEAGQPDPNDPTRFTIPYWVNGEAGIIDGRIDAFSGVQLNVRNGPATQSSSMPN
jgi:hypothetical protein